MYIFTQICSNLATYMPLVFPFILKKCFQRESVCMSMQFLCMEGYSISPCHYLLGQCKTSNYLRQLVLQIQWRRNHESSITMISTSSLASAHTRKSGMASMRARRFRIHYSMVISERASGIA